MPTSSFVVRSFEASFASSGDVARILSLTVECGQCRTTTASTTASLIELPGGALFRCVQCGPHHAVSNARLTAAHPPFKATAQPAPAGPIRVRPVVPVSRQALVIETR